MSGEIILGICPKCSHLYFEQPFPEACPSCGTHTPPMDPEVAAERHKARKEGAQLDPVVAAPTRDSQIGELFHDGLSKLRQILLEERKLLNKMEDDLDQAKKDPAVSAEVHRMIEVKLGDQERRVRALYEAEQGVSKVLALEGAERRRPIGQKQKFTHHEFIDGSLQQWSDFTNVKGVSADEINEDEFKRLREAMLSRVDDQLLHDTIGPSAGVPPKPWAGRKCPECHGGPVRWETNYLEFKEVLTCPDCQRVFNKRSPRHTAPEPLDPLEGGEP